MDYCSILTCTFWDHICKYNSLIWHLNIFLTGGGWIIQIVLNVLVGCLYRTNPGHADVNSSDRRHNCINKNCIQGNNSLVQLQSASCIKGKLMCGRNSNSLLSGVHHYTRLAQSEYSVARYGRRENIMFTCCRTLLFWYLASFKFQLLISVDHFGCIINWLEVWIEYQSQCIFFQILFLLPPWNILLL